MQNTKKLEILQSNDYGRYFVAACDIPEETVILLENVLIHAPADDVRDRVAGKKPLCLVCCRPCERNCTSCGWHICSTDCEVMQCHKNECLLFIKNKITFPPPHLWPILNKTILVLRCLLMKIHDRRVWEDFLSRLEHHSDARSTKSACKKSDNMIVENIQYFYSLCDDCPFTEKEIRTVCGVVNVNAFSGEKIEVLVSWKAKCIFEEASLFAHSCSPNCSWTIEFNQNESKCKRPNIQIEIVTAAPIKKGEMLTIFYSTRYALYGTLKRIVLMDEIAHFQCKCTRCVDRTERETFMSAVKCLDCESNYLLPEEPTEVQSNWKCLNSLCGGSQSVSKIVCQVCEIEDYVERIKDLNLDIQNELKLLSTIARKYSKTILHKNHYVLQGIAMRMVHLGVEDGILNEDKISEISLPNLELFIIECKYLLDIAHTLLYAMKGYVGNKLDRFKRHVLNFVHLFPSHSIFTHIGYNFKRIFK